MPDDTPILAISIAADYDAEAMAPFFAALPEAVTPYLDTFTLLNADGKFDTVEGKSPTAVVVTRWPSRAAFDEYWNSPAHQRAKDKREGLGSFTVLVVEDPSGSSSP
ncbi:MAG: DUF1330 domain-containing protein [Pseudomonadota bacterium]